MSEKEYFDLLIRGPNFPIDLERQAKRASLYFSFDRFWSAPTSTLVPPFSSRTNDDVINSLKIFFPRGGH